jgi:MFS family permease
MRRLPAGGPRDPGRLVLWTCFAGLFSTTFTITIFAVAVDSVAHDLGSSPETVAWAITGPFLAWAVATPVFGRVGDLYGHRRLFLLGLSGATFFGLLATVAWSAGTLIAFRTLAQLAGSAMIPASIALLYRVNPPHRRLHAVAWAFTAMSAAAASGLVIGGLALDEVGWRPLLAAQAVLSACVLIPALAVLPADRVNPRARIDVRGTALLCVGAFLLVFTVNRAPLWGLADPVILASLAALPIIFAVFVVVERRAPEPLVPIPVLMKRNVAVPLGAVFFSQFAYMGGFVITPLFLQRVLGYSAAGAALVTLTRTLSLTVASPGAGRLAWRFGERSMGIVAAVGITMGSIALLVAIPSGSVALIIIGLSLIGAGSAAQAPASLGLMTDATGDGHVGLVSSIDQMLGSIGGVIGMGALTAVIGTGSGTDPFTTAYAIAAIAACAAVVSALLVGPTKRSRHEHDEPAQLMYFP